MLLPSDWDASSHHYQQQGRRVLVFAVLEPLCDLPYPAKLSPRKQVLLTVMLA